MNRAVKSGGLPAGTRTRRIVVRAALVVVYLGLAALAFVLGKGHTILLDNKDAEDGSVSAFDGVLVTVDRQEEQEMYLGDRLAATVMGQSHTVAIEDFNGETKVERRFRVPLGADMVLLSIPKLAAGIEPALEPFTAAQAQPPADEAEVETNEFTSPEAAEATPELEGEPPAGEP